MQPDANPFAALTLIAAPAILTNASSLLTMSTNNRLARAVDRARDLTRQLEESDDLASTAASRRLRELTTAEDRSLLLLRALRSFYLALGGFAAASLLSLLGAVLVPALPRPAATALELVSVAVGFVGVGALLHGALLLVRETRLAVVVVSERAREVRARAARSAGDAHPPPD